MDPVNAAQSAVPILERAGVIGAVIICAAICIAGLTAAVIVLWRSNKAANVKLQEVQAEHCKWAHSELERRSERDHTYESIRAACELMGAELHQEHRE